MSPGWNGWHKGTEIPEGSLILKSWTSAMIWALRTFREPGWWAPLHLVYKLPLPAPTVSSVKYGDREQNTSSIRFYVLLFSLTQSVQIFLHDYFYIFHGLFNNSDNNWHLLSFLPSKCLSVPHLNVSSTKAEIFIYSVHWCIYRT